MSSLNKEEFMKNIKAIENPKEFLTDIRKLREKVKGKLEDTDIRKLKTMQKDNS